MGAPDAADHAAEVGRLRRVRRPHRLQRAAGRGDGLAAAHAAGDARGRVARSADADLGGRARPAALDGRSRSAFSEETGIRLGEVTALPGDAACSRSIGRPLEDRPADEDDGPALSLRPGALGGVSRSRRLGHRRAGERVGRHPDQHLGDLRPHLGGVAGRRRRDELRPVAAAACWRWSACCS